MKTPARLRVAIIGASHWHFENYASPLSQMDDVVLVGVGDPDESAARRRAESTGVPWATDLDDLSERTAPDFVIALGRHCDMAAEGTFLLQRGIPFVMEKPCGVNADEVRGLAELAAQTGGFAAVPFVWRLSDFYGAVSEHVTDAPFEHLSLRIVSGHPDRYRQAGCEWMLEPRLSGGGATISLSVHLIDLFRALTDERHVSVTQALLSNRSFGLEIDDRSLVVLETADACCVAETGFQFPAPTGSYDVQFTIRTARHYIRCDTTTTEIVFDRGGSVRVPTRPANEPTYARFVRHAIERFRAGRPPLTDLSDMADVMAVVGRAYALASSMPPATER